MSQAARIPTEKLVYLRQNLADHFSDSELRDVCFDLGVDYDGLTGQSKADKARELIAYLDRHGHIQDLIVLCSRLRPHISWDDARPLTDRASDLSSSRPHEQRQPGDVISVTLSGHVSGQVAVGKGITQVQAIGAAKATMTEADRAAVYQMLSGLKARVEVESPPEQKQAAIERIKELGEALTAQEPDLTTIEYVQRWFVKNVPRLVEEVNGIISQKGKA